ADDLALGLGIAHPRERGQELLGRVDHHQAGTAAGAAEGLLDLGGLVLAHEPVVDVHAGQSAADGTLHEGGGHGRVHAAGQGADGGPLAHLGTDPLDLFVDHATGGPVGSEGGTAV